MPWATGFHHRPRRGLTPFTYDAKDRLATVAEPLGHATTYAYDAVDNQVSVTDALGHATTNIYDTPTAALHQGRAESHDELHL